MSGFLLVQLIAITKWRKVRYKGNELPGGCELENLVVLHKQGFIFHELTVRSPLTNAIFAARMNMNNTMAPIIYQDVKLNRKRSGKGHKKKELCTNAPIFLRVRSDDSRCHGVMNDEWCSL
jgi:hypothetical protein